MSAQQQMQNALAHGKNLVRWTVWVVPIGVMAGSASAFFLWALEKVTDLRVEHGWIIYFLPVAGIAVAAAYHWLGRSAERGNSLILDQIHEAGGGVPVRMAPLVLFATLITHLFGGSAGREGTAVQMGGSLASGFGQLCRVDRATLRIFLMAGVAAGFGSVFGTPLAGAVFAMEVLVVGHLQYSAVVPVLVASLIGDAVCGAWGIHHTAYHIAIDRGAGALSLSSYPLWGKLLVASIGFGLVSQLFSRLTHGLQHALQKLIPASPVRAACGGVLILVLTWLLGTRDYLGLGVHSPDPHAVTILSAFAPGGATPWSWWWKLLFTAVTLSTGFKGGEVTPLFFIGAALGNTFAVLLHAPVDLFAGLGFVAVFAGASNTPLACTIMATELFGAGDAAFFAAGCFVAYFFSGYKGIYSSQRSGAAKKFSWRREAEGQAISPR